MKHKPRTRERSIRTFPEIPPQILGLMSRINQVCRSENPLNAVIATGLLFGEGIHRANYTEQEPINEFLSDLRVVLRRLLKGVDTEPKATRASGTAATSGETKRPPRTALDRYLAGEE